MKIKIYYLLFALMALLMSCANSPRTETDSFLEYEVIEIDSCEYILIQSSTYGVDTYIKNIVHKGNCKYCEERRDYVGS